MKAPPAFELQDLGGGRFAVTGVMGFPSASALLERSEKMFDGQTAWEIDLKGVTQADSAGLALLIEWLSWAKQRARPIKFLNLPEQIRAIARISEVEELLEPKSG